MKKKEGVLSYSYIYPNTYFLEKVCSVEIFSDCEWNALTWRFQFPFTSLIISISGKFQVAKGLWHRSASRWSSSCRWIW
jgi:hypothetical protein